jgi:hypothetical protein
MSIPKVGNICSAVLELKNMRAMSFPQVIMSNNVNWATQAKVVAPRAIKDRLSALRNLKNVGVCAGYISVTSCCVVLQ